MKLIQSAKGQTDSKALVVAPAPDAAKKAEGAIAAIEKEIAETERAMADATVELGGLNKRRREALRDNDDARLDELDRQETRCNRTIERLGEIILPDLRSKLIEARQLRDTVKWDVLAARLRVAELIFVERSEAVVDALDEIIRIRDESDRAGFGEQLRRYTTAPPSLIHRDAVMRFKSTL